MRLSLLHRVKEIKHEIEFLEFFIKEKRSVEYHQEQLRILHTDLFFILASKKKKAKLYEEMRADLPTKTVDEYFRKAGARISNMR
jgi:hypothetical protein